MLCAYDQVLVALTSREFPLMVQPITLIRGITRPIYSSSISRESIRLYDHRENSFHDTHSVGVGYSYAEFGETVETTEEAARNVYAFLTIFFETFKQFTGRRFHLSGESYAVNRFVESYVVHGQA